MPVEIDLLKINANGLERVWEANLTNLFGVSNDDFLSFQQEKKLATHSSVTGDKKTMQRSMVNKPTWIPISTMNSFSQIGANINKMLINLTVQQDLID